VTELNSEDWDYPDLAGRPLTRRTLINTIVAASVASALGAEFITSARPAEAATYVQYEYPFPKTAISQHFNSNHGATDWGTGVSRNDVIGAIADGTVTKSEYGPLGNSVELKHADGKYSGYCHMVAPSSLNVGDKVKRGATVGKVGNSASVANHLHLAIATAVGWSIQGQPYSNCIDAETWIDAHLSPAPNPGGQMFIKGDDGTWYVVGEFTVHSTGTQSVANKYAEVYGGSTQGVSPAAVTLVTDNANNSRQALIDAIAAAVVTQLNS
jgi:murein DD-endopeptidase MepM/ murein hydrolase activator NlpD